MDAIVRRNTGAALLKAGNTSGLPVLRVAVLGSFNMSMIKPLLAEALHRSGVWAEIHIGDFGRIEEDLLNPDSGTHRFQPGAILIVPAAEDALRPLYERPALFGREAGGQLAADAAAGLDRAVQTALSLGNAAIFPVVMLPEHPPGPNVLDSLQPHCGQQAVYGFLDRVRAIGQDSARVAVIDWARHARQQGPLYDDRMWYLARMRLSLGGLANLASLFARHWIVYRGPARKAAIVDLDNTLWGGVVGEAGVSGLELGGDGIGYAFQEFQREMLKLRDIGIVLAICSKNNAADAWEVFDSHPSMILKREHFADAAINWEDKVRNIRDLAMRLNLGTDSFVFLDDNPVERGLVSSFLPEVLTPDLPADPTERPRFLREGRFFETLRVTSADLARAESYREQGIRTALREQSSNIDDYIASLDQQVRVAAVNKGSLARAAQLCQRTNQFNLTIRRHTTAVIERMLQDPAFDVRILSVKDRFGDNGIVGLSIVEYANGTAVIDTFLMSCRVLGRRVEDAFLSVIARRASARGAERLRGQFIPTAKNQQVAAFYPARGFAAGPDEGWFELPLKEGNFQPPSGILVIEDEDD